MMLSGTISKIGTDHFDIYKSAILCKLPQFPVSPLILPFPSLTLSFLIYYIKKLLMQRPWLFCQPMSKSYMVFHQFPPFPILSPSQLA